MHGVHFARGAAGLCWDFGKRNKNRLWRSHGRWGGKEIHRIGSGSVLDSRTFNNRVKLLKHTFSRVSYFPGDAAVECSSNTGGRRN